LTDHQHGRGCSKLRLFAIAQAPRAIDADRPIRSWRGISRWFGVQFMAESSVGKRFGIVDDDRQRAMSGLEFVQGLVNGTLPLNTMAQTLGYDIVEVSKGRVVA